MYARLLEILKAGESAAVVTDYHASGAVTRRLMPNTDAAAAAEVDALQKHPDAVAHGPVTHIRRSDTAMTVVENYAVKPRLIIIGAGHVALALAQMAKLADFTVIVFDDRSSFANTERFACADEVVCDGFGHLFERIAIQKTDYVVIVTRGHQYDAVSLAGVLSGVEPCYTGMIGSKRRVAIVKKQLALEGADSSRLERLHSPIGLAIGAVTPAEIAVSILAEILSVKRLASATCHASCDLEAVEAIAAGMDADALITIVDTFGSAPNEPGAKLAMSYTGAIQGTVGGGCGEADAMRAARELIAVGGWRWHTIDLNDSAEDEGMVCGGEMRLIIETLD
jgi:xanthine dehydrogenase accessory factor